MKSLILVCFFFLLSLTSWADTYSVAHINLGYGKLDVSSGGGYLNVSVDKENKLTKIAIDVNAGMFGVYEDIYNAISIKELTSGNVLSFYMRGSIEPILKITPQTGFSADGGKVKFSVRKSDGFYYQMVEIAKGSKTKNYYLWGKDSIIDEIAINVRGSKASEMYVGWYEIVTA